MSNQVEIDRLEAIIQSIEERGARAHGYTERDQLLFTLKYNLAKLKNPKLNRIRKPCRIGSSGTWY